MTSLTVYGIPVSTYVRAVILLLESIEIDYTVESINIFNGENKTPEYLTKNPFGKIPTLVVDEETIYETLAITDYINTVFANQKFSPADPLLKARMLQIISIINTYLYPAAIGTIVIQRMIVPQEGGKTDLEKVQQAIDPTRNALEAIESLMQQGTYLLGGSLSLADFHLIPIFVYISKVPEYAAITAETPNLKAWFERVLQLPTVKKVCA
jgi:glutathione S-transferase